MGNSILFMQFLLGIVLEIRPCSGSMTTEVARSKETETLSEEESVDQDRDRPTYDGPAAMVRRSGGAGDLVRGSLWLGAVVVISALGGFAFWVVAARVGAPSTVGRASALFTLALMLNWATGLGLPVAVARYAHDQSPGARTLFSWAVVLTTLSSAVGAAILLAVLPARVAAPLWYWGRPAGFLLFFAVVTGMSFTNLVDVRLMALRKWRWVLIRAVAVAVVRLPFVTAHPIGNDATWLFLLVAGSQALSGLTAIAFIQRPARLLRRLRALPASTANAVRYAGVNYLSQLAVQAPFFAVPLIVLLHVSPAQNASFYVAWSIMTVVFVVNQAMGQVVLVEGGKEGADLHRQMRLAVLLAGGVTVLASVAALFGSSLLVVMYGHAYRKSAQILFPLVIANVGWCVTSICVAECRVREHARSTVLITMAFSAAILVPAALLTASQGVDGAVRAWVFGNILAAAVAVRLAARTRTPERRSAAAQPTEVARAMAS
jgi:O-antigen/teichoic acid export membrane protein